MPQTLSEASLSPSIPKLRGCQEPSYHYIPPGVVRDYAKEADEWLRQRGVKLFPWQLFVLAIMLSVRNNEDFGIEEDELPYKWAYDTFGLLVSRQQGKSELIVAFILLRFFVFTDRNPKKPNSPNQIIYTSQLTKTSTEVFTRLRNIIEADDELRNMVNIRGGQGKEDITALPSAGEIAGDTILFLSRSPQSGRGQQSSVVIFDEAQDVTSDSYDALGPTLSTAYSPVEIYLGTVPKEGVHHMDAFEAVRDIGRAGDSDSVAWVEWTPKGSHDPLTALEIDISDPAVWAQANPSLGRVVQFKTLESAYKKAKRIPKSFKRERLSIWPNRAEVEVNANNELDMAKWRETYVPVLTEENLEWTLALSVNSAGGQISMYGAVSLNGKQKPQQLIDREKKQRNKLIEENRDNNSFSIEPIKETYSEQDIYVEHLGTIVNRDDAIIKHVERFQETLNIKTIVVGTKNARVLSRSLDANGIEYVSYADVDVATALEQYITRFNEGHLFHPVTVDPNGQFVIDEDDVVELVLEEAEIRTYGRGDNITRYWGTDNETEIVISVIKAMTLAVYAIEDTSLTDNSGEFWSVE